MPESTICPAPQSRSEHPPKSASKADACSFQDIRKSKVDPGKLVALLRTKFGAGGYEIYTVHNVYTIRAPEKLSEDDLALCK
ncbi:hypothetical protein SAMD00023353_4400590 [Rosellinia necatrix]|uniref:Uncharacterized protein n=1 Tax=Rosellinia necatrix TaxID=77044 RepID=A0A1W2TNK2_ROSNE|nr:hypothetical protein SAMD00023353_4400590 [Rosellinia necatrix]